MKGLLVETGRPGEGFPRVNGSSTKQGADQSFVD